VEAAVRVQERGVAAVASQTPAGRDENGNARAVLRLVEGGARLVERVVERRRDGLERLEPTGAQVVAVHAGWAQGGAEREEEVAPVGPAVQSRRRAHIRQRHLAPRGAGEVEQPQAAR